MSEYDTSRQHASPGDLIGRDAYDPAGDKIGRIDDVFVDGRTGEPTWLAVSTGMFGLKTSFVPVGGASWSGDDLIVGYTKDEVKDAPRVDPDQQLSGEEERELYAHYGRLDDWGDDDAPGAGVGDEPVGHERPEHAEGDAGASGVLRSEEELDVHTTQRAAGRARLKKWIETENVQLTVPVRREKAKLVRETVDGDVEARIGDDGHEEEIVLTEEVVDVDKRVVAKERVRLETETETEEVRIEEEVRKERVGLEEDGNGESRRPDEQR